MQLLGDAMPAALAIALTACVGVLAALIALKQTGRPAVVWAALGIAAVVAAFAAVATQRHGGGPVAGPATVAPAGAIPSPPRLSTPTAAGTPTATETTAAPTTSSGDGPGTGGPDPSTIPGWPARTTTDSATRHANRDAFTSGVLAGFAAPVIGAAQTCQGEQPAGGEAEVVVCYLPGDYQVRYLRWASPAERDRQRRQFDVLDGVPSRWKAPDGRWAGALRAAVHDGVEGDYAKVYWDLDCSPVGAILYGPSGPVASLAEVRRYWHDVTLDLDRTC